MRGEGPGDGEADGAAAYDLHVGRACEFVKFCVVYVHIYNIYMNVFEYRSMYGI